MVSNYYAVTLNCVNLSNLIPSSAALKEFQTQLF